MGIGRVGTGRVRQPPIPGVLFPLLSFALLKREVVMLLGRELVLEGQDPWPRSPDPVNLAFMEAQRL